MSNETYVGDSGLVWAVSYEDDTGNKVDLDGAYTCKMVVVKEDNLNTKIVDRAVSTKNAANNAFLASLTTAETTSLKTGNHKVSVWIIATGIMRRKEFRFKISDGGAPLPS